MGWQGSLRPGGDSRSLALTEQARVCHLHLSIAINTLKARVPVEHLAWRRVELPVEQLLSPLLHRLMAIRAGACYRTSERSDGKTCLIAGGSLSFSADSPLSELVMEQWVCASAIFLARLHADAAKLAAWMEVSPLPAVAELTSTASDLHDDSGSSIKIEFTDGHCIYYKPRSVTGEFLWHELTQLTGTIDPACKVASAGVLQGAGDYGWMNELRRSATNSEGARARYWERAGSLLCHAWLAHLGDLHMANVIATGEGPGVVDAECLGTPCPDVQDGRDPILELATELNSTGLVPSGQRIFIAGREAYLPDVSGLFGHMAPAGSLLIPDFEDGGDGKCLVSFKHAVLQEQQNRIDNARPITCLSAMVEGFLCAASAFLQVREELAAPGAWIDQVERSHAPRINLRSTLSYGLQMSEGVFACAAGDGDVKSEQTGLALVDLSGPSPIDRCAILKRSAILEEEKRSLDSLYIPRFFSPAGSRTISAGTGAIIAENSFPFSGAHCIRRRLERLARAELSSSLKTALLSSLLQG